MLTTAILLYLAGSCFFGSLVRKEAPGRALVAAIAFWPLLLFLMAFNHLTSQD